MTTPAENFGEQKGSRGPYDLRTVTVLFADVVDSTAITTRFNPETAATIIDAPVNVVAQEIERHGGTFIKHLGDGAMAIFGMPKIQEDHGIRACHAAIRIQERMKDVTASLREKFHAQVVIRIGLNSGPVVSIATIGGEQTPFDAMGATVTLATRIESVTAPGKVGLSANTFQLVRRAFECRDAGFKSLKGINGSQRIYELVKPTPATQTRGLSDHKLASPLIGRLKEVQQVEQSIGRLLSGAGGALLISGEAGVGKTRLMLHCKENLPTGIRWLNSGALSFGQNISYWPFIELLRPIFFGSSYLVEKEAWSIFELQMLKLFGDEAAALMPYVGTLLGIDLPANYLDRIRSLDRDELGGNVFRAARRLFEVLASDGPVVIVFDDIHWFDRSSLLLLAHIFPLAAIHSILFLCLSRPDAEALTHCREAAAKELHGRFQEIGVQPLSVADSQSLLTSILSDDAHTRHVRDLIIYKAEGNPFFIEEAIRALIDSKVLSHDAGIWTVHNQDIAIPNTIEGVLLERFDRLDTRLKEVLGIAAVIGRTFLYRVLRTVVTPNIDIVGDLQKLSAIEIIEQLRTAPELSYLFRHALARDAIYDNLLGEKRLHIHARVAECLESLFSDRLSEVASILAYHYAHSGKWEKALQYLLAAAEQSDRMAADHEALVYYEEAVAAYARAYGESWDQMERARVELRMGEIHFRRGDHDRALDCFRQALLRYGDTLPNRTASLRWTEALELIRHIILRLTAPDLLTVKLRGQLAPADETYIQLYHSLIPICFFADQKYLLLLILRAFARAYEIGETKNIASASAVIGWSLSHFGSFRLAQAYIDRASRAAEVAQDVGTVGLVTYIRGLHCYFRGKLGEATSCFLHARPLSDQAGILVIWTSASIMLCIIKSESSEYDDASRYAEELIQFGRDAAYHTAVRWGLLGKGMVLRRIGDLKQARSVLDEALQLSVSSGDFINLATVTAELALVVLEQEGTDAADQIIAGSREELSVTKMVPHTISFVHVAAAEIQIRRYETDRQTRESAKEAVSRCAVASRCARRYPFIQPSVRRLEARLAFLRGDLKRAKRLAHQALKEADEMGLQRERALMERDLGVLLGSQ